MLATPQTATWLEGTTVILGASSRLLFSDVVILSSPVWLSGGTGLGRAELALYKCLSIQYNKYPRRKSNCNVEALA